MRRSLYHLTFLVSVGALALTTMPASGFHAWSGYHWQRSSNPVTIELGDNVDSGWDGWLVAASADWSASTVLDVPVAAGQAKGNCKPPSGRVEVCNKSYGYCAPGFLGHGLRENLMSKEVAGMVQSRRVQGAGSARTEGARRATGVGADAAAAGARALAPGQRWSASRKRDVVLRLLCGESLDAVSRAVGVEIYRLEEWKARALAGLELGLKEQAGEPVAAVLDAAKRHIGALSMENELLRARARAAERRLPLATRRSR